MEEPAKESAPTRALGDTSDVSGDPHKLLFMLIPNPVMLSGFKAAFPQETVIDVGKVKNEESPLEDFIVDSVIAQFRKYGTIKEIVLAGHGDSEVQAMGNSPTLEGLDPTNSLHLPTFLEKLKARQEELRQTMHDPHLNLTDRIVFGGCDVFTNFDPGTVDYYRRIAQKLGAQLVGSTNVVVDSSGMGALDDNPDFNKLPKEERDKVRSKREEQLRRLGAPDTPILSGRFVEFNPSLRGTEADVVRDPLDKDSDAQLKKEADYESYLLGKNPGWAECHVGKSQNEGVACQLANAPGLMNVPFCAYVPDDALPSWKECNGVIRSGSEGTTKQLSPSDPSFWVPVPPSGPIAPSFPTPPKRPQRSRGS